MSHLPILSFSFDMDMAKAAAKPWAFGFSAPDKFPVLVLRQAITLWFYSKCHLKRTAGRRDAFFFFLAGLKNYQSMGLLRSPSNRD